MTENLYYYIFNVKSNQNKGSRCTNMEISHLPFPVALIDHTYLLIQFNKKFKKLFKKATIGLDVREFFPTFEIEKDDQLLTYKKFVNYVFIKNLIAHQKFIVIGMESDEIQTLKKEVKELQTYFDETYEGIYITDAKGITLRTNKAIERITGIPKEYYIGKNVSQLMQRGILKNSVTQEVVRTGKTVSLVQKNYIGNITLLTGSPITNENGEVEKVVTVIRDLTELNRIHAENSHFNHSVMNEKIDVGSYDKGIIIKNKQMKSIFQQAKRVANFDATILILGETGVGKDVLANFIYNQSSRKEKGKLIKVNCGAIPPELLESELFGYEAGAFTGANKSGKQGMFELANNGILFLDEIGELPLNLQVKLLRVLQEGEIQKIGSTKIKKVNVQIIAATNRNLHEMVTRGEFREDLYYRLNVIPLYIPPLRERRDEILPLIHHFLSKFNQKYLLNKEFNYEVIDFLISYNWPGNIRELANLIERLVVTTPENEIKIEHMPPEYKNSVHVNTNQQISLKEAVEETERKILERAAKKYRNTYEIAKALRTSQPTVVRKLKKYNIKPKMSS